MCWALNAVTKFCSRACARLQNLDGHWHMPEKFVIKGGKPLNGVVEVRGSKNAATKMMIAALLTEEPCVLENIPLSAEVDITRELCESLGARVVLDRKERRCVIQAKVIKDAHIPELSRKNRISILALGPLLHRKGIAEVPVLGGCPIGHRPINFHVEALSKMGARIERRERSYYAEAPSKLRGAEIELPYPSVGATENVILASTLAQGRTFLKNAAMEPEILDLVRMLSLMGARLKVLPGRSIEIEGVSGLRGVKVEIMPDRTEAVSFAAAALATEGDLYIQNARREDLHPFLEKVKSIGGEYEFKSSGIRFRGRKPYRPVEIETAPHPGFMTDWQSPFAVLLTQAGGESIIHETVYEDRLGYLGDLNRMGARSRISEECWGSARQCRFRGKPYQHSAKILGPTALRGAEIKMPDIRSGMAHIIAALAARGESVITGVEHIDRGYERIDERLKSLGAQIQRLSR